jgi:HAD superfamily hydrolase (TIGR01509 family)
LIAAVVFDLDGVLVQSEEVWDAARRELVAASGRRWPPEATSAMMGMSSVEWSRYLSERLEVPAEPPQISERVVRAVADRYRRRLPWIPGAREAVARLASRWPLALATSSNREIIDLVLEAGGLRTMFAATVSSEEVERGKPAPDVYLEAARRLGVTADRCAAVEDSSNGLLAAAAAGMRAIAIPNPDHPPSQEALRAAAAVLPSLDELTPEVVSGLAEPG